MSAPQPPLAARSTFQIMPRSGIWHVTLDKRFFGDYSGKLWAMEGVEEKAKALRATGALVQIVILSSDGAVLSDQKFA